MMYLTTPESFFNGTAPRVMTHEWCVSMHGHFSNKIAQFVIYTIFYNLICIHIAQMVSLRHAHRRPCNWSRIGNISASKAFFLAGFLLVSLYLSPMPHRGQGQHQRDGSRALMRGRDGFAELKDSFSRDIRNFRALLEKNETQNHLKNARR